MYHIFSLHTGDWLFCPSFRRAGYAGRQLRDCVVGISDVDLGSTHNCNEGDRTQPLKNGQKHMRIHHVLASQKFGKKLKLQPADAALIFKQSQEIQAFVHTAQHRGIDV